MRIPVTRRWDLHAFADVPGSEDLQPTESGLVYGIREALWHNSEGTLGGWCVSLELGRWFRVAIGAMRR